MKFDHLSIPVADPIASAQWFVDLFPPGTFSILYQSAEWVFLKMGDAKIAFVKEELHPAHFAILMDSEEQLDLLAEAWGQEVLQERPDTLNFFVVGPEGICIEFVYYLRDFNDNVDAG